MRMIDKEIEVIRGETFTLDFTVINNDKSPFIISSALEHPYMLITIASTDQAQPNRFVLNHWLDLSGLPRFASTVPLAADYEDIAGSSPYFPPKKQGSSTRFSNTTFGVFTATGPNGTVYKYYKNGSYLDYDLHIADTFEHNETSELVEKNYTYSVTFLNGITVSDYIDQLYDIHVPETEKQPDANILDKYVKLTEYEPTLMEHTPLDQPIYAFDTYTVILEPTKLVVNGNQQQFGMYNNKVIGGQ